LRLCNGSHRRREETQEVPSLVDEVGGLIDAALAVRELPRPHAAAEEKDDTSEELYGVFKDWESSFNRTVAPVSEKRGCDRDSKLLSNSLETNRNIVVSGPKDTQYLYSSGV
jgi:hypothetical protein